MNIGEIIKSKRAKDLMNKAYSWGAAIVILGALFKLQHWQYSGPMLTVGLLVEVFIFFVSGFEPAMDQPDWSKVYPELQDDYDLMEPTEVVKPKAKGNLNELLSNTNITPELLAKLGQSLIELSNTASGISEISSATLATEVYVKNLNSAAESVITFSDVNNKANTTLANSIDELVGKYGQTAGKISEAGQDVLVKLNESSAKFSHQLEEAGHKLIESHQKFSGNIEKGFKDLETTSSNYSENIHKLNKHIDALGSTYEKQLKGTQEQMQASSKFFDDINQMNQMIASSVQELKKYKDNAEKLNSHLDALNSIYGNMLGAMNYTKK